MSERTSQAVELIGDVAEKAKDAVMMPVHGAFALAKAVVGGDEEENREVRRPRGDEPSTETRGEPSSKADAPSTDAEAPGAETDSAGAASSEQTSDGPETDDEVSLEEIWGVGAARAEDLREEGFERVAHVAEATTDDLAVVSGIGESTAQKMIDSASDLV